MFLIILMLMNEATQGKGSTPGMEEIGNDDERSPDALLGQLMQVDGFVVGALCLGSDDDGITWQPQLLCRFE